MNKLLTVLAATALPVCAFAQDMARSVIERFAGKELPIDLSINLSKENGHDVYATSVAGGKLKIEGSSEIALCRGFYDFVRSNGLGIASWSGNRLVWPAKLKQQSRKQVVAPFNDYYYLNVVTFGYSAPYWDWERWQKEIDWMALHGIDMPLALVGQEAISKRVWKKLGLTDEEIDNYFVGPAHLPWMRMGNVSGIDGPMPDEWHADQVALEHKILDRMKALGMKPITPAFAGFVPQAITRLYPDEKITETTWLGGSFRNWLLDPTSPLFGKMGTMFIEEWEKEFGKNDRYIADTFNEMDAAFPEKGDPARYKLMSDFGNAVYGSIHRANPDAIWVMQGWMFGYQRHIWDFETLQALVSKVPDDKLLLLDLATDYNTSFWKNEYNWEFYKGLFNKPWVYSVIPNMGGKTGLSGVPEYYANGRFNALNSPNKGRLTGYGMAPEGIDNNEVLYELVMDGGWTADSIDITEWYRNYQTSRYGQSSPFLDKYWQGLQKSVYSSLVDNARFNWQFRPGMVSQGNIVINDDFFLAMENFHKAVPQLKDSPLFVNDLIENTVHYVSAKMEYLIKNWEAAYEQNEMNKCIEIEKQFTDLALGIDRLLVSHPTLRMEGWIAKARSHGSSKELKDYYERNVRRLITIWGGDPVEDYAARIWSGLIRDYYVPRWQNYFESKRTGKDFNLSAWEHDWVEKQTGLSEQKPYADVVSAAMQLMAQAKGVKLDVVDSNANKLGTWGSGDFQSGAIAEKSWNLPVAKTAGLKGVKFRTTRGINKIEISNVAAVMDGISYPARSVERQNDGSFVALIDIPASATGNNSSRLVAKIKCANATDSHGEVLIVK